MFDDLRQQADASGFDDNAELVPEQSQAQGRFLGMTPVQRVLLAFITLLLACLLSAFCLLVTEKVVFPF